MKSDHQRKYTHYYLHVDNINGINGNVSDATSVPGETLSKAVEKFLREILKDDKLTVKIEAHETEVRQV